jgi:hypothetical protein
MMPGTETEMQKAVFREKNARSFLSCVLGGLHKVRDRSIRGMRGEKKGTKASYSQMETKRECKSGSLEQALALFHS